MKRTGLWTAAALAGALVLGLAACQSEEDEEQKDAGLADATSKLACTLDDECGIGEGCVQGYCAPCLDGAPCNEACQDEVANLAPTASVANTWRLSGSTVSNSGVLSAFTNEARRCQWTKLSDQCGWVNCLKSDWPAETSTLIGHSAGTVTLSNDRGFSEVFEPDPNGFYALRHTPITFRWIAGDRITVEAAGDEIPAYRRTYLFPEAVTVTSPMAGDAGEMLTVDVNADFVVTWTPTQGKVIVDFGQGLPYGEMDYQELGCDFDAAAGSGTIPAAMMQRLKTDAGLRTGFGIASHVKKCFRVGDFHLQTSSVNGRWRDVTVQ